MLTTTNHSILIVDRDPAIRSVIAEILSDEGFLVDTASDGEAAWSKLEAGQVPTLILLDDENGREFRRRQLVSPWAAIPLMWMTSSSLHMEVDLVRGERCGCLQKPFALDELLAEVRRMTQPPAPHGVN